jgi:hypothetical protein
MNEVNCRSVCLQIEEAELGWTPSGALRSHLERCEKCGQFLEEQTKLRQMVAGIGHVQAPSDFDFRLRARMAAENNKGSSFLPRFSFGIPTAAVAALLVLVAGVIGLRVMRVQPVAGPSSPESTVRVLPLPEPTERVQIAEVNPPAKAEEPNDVEKIVHNPARQVTTNRKPRVATREYSSAAAEVVKRDEPAADQEYAFKIDGSQQSLKVSLEDGAGVYRTISVPRVSFGSQRTFGEQPIFVKTSSNGAW